MTTKELTDAMLLYRASITIYNKIIKTRVKDTHNIGGGVTTCLLYAYDVPNSGRSLYTRITTDQELLSFCIYLIRIKIQAFYVTKD